jgi:hypothetical protein
MSSVEVHQVPPGSLIVVKGVRLDEAAGGAFADEVKQALGHSQFVLVEMDNAGDVEVLTDPEQFPDWLYDKLLEAAQRKVDEAEEAGRNANRRKPLRIQAGAIRRG